MPTFIKRGDMVRIFFPAKITDISYSNPGYWFSDKKVGILIVIVAVDAFIFYSMVRWALPTWLFWVVTAIILFITQWAVATFVLEEKRQRALIEDYSRGMVEDAIDAMDIISLESSGKLLYGSGAIGYVVRLNRGSVVNRPDDFDVRHREYVADVIRELLRAELLMYRINTSQTSYYNIGIEHHKKLVEEAEGNLKLLSGYIVTEISKYNRAISDIEVDYWVIYTRNVKLTIGLKQRIEAALVKLRGSLYYSWEVLDKEAVSDFLKQEYGLTHLSLDGRIRQSQELLEDAFSIISTYDDEGYEIATQQIIE